MSRSLEAAKRGSDKWREKTEAQHIEEQASAQNELGREKRMWDVAKMWFEGYTIPQIADTLKHATQTVLHDIQDMRKVITEWHKGDVAELAAERIEGFRLIQRKALEIAEIYPRQSTQLLSLIYQSEVSIAKVQGVLSDKVQHLGTVTHKIKLYDFEDKFPESKVTGEFRAIEAAHTPAVKGSESKAKGFNPDESVIIDGEVIEGEATIIELDE